MRVTQDIFLRTTISTLCSCFLEVDCSQDTSPKPTLLIDYTLKIDIPITPE